VIAPAFTAGHASGYEVALGGQTAVMRRGSRVVLVTAGLYVFSTLSMRAGMRGSSHSWGASLLISAVIVPLVVTWVLVQRRMGWGENRSRR
jgi:hypothetical protein